MNELYAWFVYLLKALQPLVLFGGEIMKHSKCRPGIFFSPQDNIANTTGLLDGLISYAEANQHSPSVRNWDNDTN